AGAAVVRASTPNAIVARGRYAVDARARSRVREQGADTIHVAYVELTAARVERPFPHVACEIGVLPFAVAGRLAPDVDGSALVAPFPFVGCVRAADRLRALQRRPRIGPLVRSTRRRVVPLRFARKKAAVPDAERIRLVPG